MAKQECNQSLRYTVSDKDKSKIQGQKLAIPRQWQCQLLLNVVESLEPGTNVNCGMFNLGATDSTVHFISVLLE